MVHRFLALALLMSLPAVVVGQGGAHRGYVPRRTPWGDPDLQGHWPGTSMMGVPRARADSATAVTFEDLRI